MLDSVPNVEAVALLPKTGLWNCEVTGDCNNGVDNNGNGEGCDGCTEWRSDMVEETVEDRVGSDVAAGFDTVVVVVVAMSVDICGADCESVFASSGCGMATWVPEAQDSKGVEAVDGSVLVVSPSAPSTVEPVAVPLTAVSVVASFKSDAEAGAEVVSLLGGEEMAESGFVVETGLDAFASDSCFSCIAFWAAANATDTLARMVMALAAEGNRAGGSGDKSGLGGGSFNS